MRICIPTVVLLGAAMLGAQVPVSHEPGVVVTVDFDTDGTDEFVIVDSGSLSHGYGGSLRTQAVNASVSQPLGRGSLVNVPVVNDRTLYAVGVDAASVNIMVTSYAIERSGRFRELSMTVYPALAGRITTVQACPYDRDLDGDGNRDLIMAWTEVDGSGARSYCRLHTPTLTRPHMEIQKPAFAATNPKVLSIHRGQTPSMQSDEYLVGMTSGDDELFGGFGFVLLYQGTTQAGGVWFPMLPTLLLDDRPRIEDENVAYGCFSPFPRFGVPLVKTFTGRSARLGLDSTEPFVARRGEVLKSTEYGKQLPRCIADYDDDGNQEMVWVEYLDNSPHPHLVVADPGPNRRQIFVVPLVSTQGRSPLYVHHGASGDFDGDGDPDIVLSVWQGNPLLGSGIVYIRTDRLPQRGETVLNRVR